jgi:ABC-type multidrug transport system fused ATPase/permease subunit
MVASTRQRSGARQGLHPRVCARPEFGGARCTVQETPIGMERSLFRYILKHTWRQQVLLLIVTAISFPLIYINLELPKRIVNGAIGGRNVPQEILGFEITQVSYLMVLSVSLLTLIALNGGIKYWLNVYRGIVGERMVRRLRFELNQALMRFPLPHFKKTSAGEIIPMVTAETDPIGSFIGESISLPAFQGGLLLTYLTFIFVQDPWLGAAAVALYPPQVWLIPRLQRRINQLAKRRIQTTRELSDRIGDVIGGATDVRANDTQRYELADASNRLGTIYDIRVSTTFWPRSRRSSSTRSAAISSSRASSRWARWWPCWPRTRTSSTRGKNCSSGMRPRRTCGSSTSRSSRSSSRRACCRPN